MPDRQTIKVVGPGLGTRRSKLHRKAWYEATLEGIQRRQAVHSLAGFTHAVEGGQKPQAAQLPPLVRDLYKKLQRSRVRINDQEIPDRQTIEVVGPRLGTRRLRR